MTTADPTYEYQHDDEGSIRECWSCNMRAPVSTFGIRDGNAVVRDRLLCEFCARTSITHVGTFGTDTGRMLQAIAVTANMILDQLRPTCIDPRAEPSHEVLHSDYLELKRHYDIVSRRNREATQLIEDARNMLQRRIDDGRAEDEDIRRWMERANAY